MALESGTEHEWTFAPASEMSNTGGASTCFAVPMIIDGDTRISQSQAISQFVGKKCGFTEGVDADKALQFMLDVTDLNTEFGKAQTAGMADLKKFLEVHTPHASPPARLTPRCAG